VGAGAEEATRDTNSDDGGGDHFHLFVAEGREQGEHCELSDWRMAEVGSIRRTARRMEHRSG